MKMNYLKLLVDLWKLKQNEKMSQERMQKLQDEKLRKLLFFAWNHSAYYRRTFEAVGIQEEQLGTLPISAFPTIDKNILLEHFDELVTIPELKQEELRAFDEHNDVDRKPYQGKYHVVHSSGSTGKPGYFVYDKEAWSSMLLGIIRGALWDMSMPQILSLLVKRPRIVYIAATDGRYGGAMAVGDGVDGVGASQLYLDIKTPLTEWIRELRKFKPNIVIGYPSAIKILAQLMEEGKVKLDVCRVISCGEPLGASLRHYLEEVFGTITTNIYGASESLAMGVEMNLKEGMLLFDDMNLIEVEDGVMYLTSLYNFAQPLIRYRLSDNLTLQEAEEGNRYPFTKAVGLLGRNEDILWFEDGNGHKEFLHPLAVEGFCIEGLKDYQFRQTTKDTFEMQAETSRGANKEKIRKEMLRQMKGMLAEKNLGYVQFYVNFVDEILPDSSTGKKPLIVGKVIDGMLESVKNKSFTESFELRTKSSDFASSMAIKRNKVLLQGQNICKTFGKGQQGNIVLDAVNVEIYEGDFTVIMGASGAGKSTLLYALSGIDTITSGKVFYKEKEINGLPEKQMAELRAGEFGFVFQQTHLVSNLTLFENVAVAGYVGKIGSPKAVREKAKYLLNQMHVESAVNRMPHQVSGGEAQRAAIARAVIGEPGLLFADEPTGALNKANSDEVLNLLTGLSTIGQSILMVTHDLRAAIRGSRLLYLEDGRVLDELRLSAFKKEEEKGRKNQISTWLASMQW